MIFDVFLAGSIGGYLLYRIHRTFSESISELVWVVLGVASAVYLYQPTAVTLRLDKIIGPGIGNVFGFFVVSLVFLALRHFFLRVHHFDEAKKKEKKKEGDSSVVASPEKSQSSFSGVSSDPAKHEPALPIDFRAFAPALLSALITVSFSLTIATAMPQQVLPGGADLRGSTLAKGVLTITEPMRPPVEDLVGGAWRDIERILTPGNAQVSGEAFAALLPDTEWEMFALINELREREGVAPLAFEKTLRTEARAHSREMVALGFFSHDSPRRGNLRRRLDQSGLVYRNAAENLAEALSARQAVQELMKSAHHRNNILNPAFSRTGIGASKGRNGSVMLVQIFSD